jgi:hypothetical protein
LGLRLRRAPGEGRIIHQAGLEPYSSLACLEFLPANNTITSSQQPTTDDFLSCFLLDVGHLIVRYFPVRAQKGHFLVKIFGGFVFFLLLCTRFIQR